MNTAKTTPRIFVNLAKKWNYPLIKALARAKSIWRKTKPSNHKIMRLKKILLSLLEISFLNRIVGKMIEYLKKQWLGINPL